MTTATTPDTGREMETITSVDGTEIAFERTGSGPPLVLVHGTGFDHSFWDLSSVRSALAEHNTVYAIDRRGRGGSGDVTERSSVGQPEADASGDADVYDLEREIEDVAAVVKSIDGPMTLLGHSFGANVALEAAARIDTLQGLVLYEPAIPFEEGLPHIEQLLGTIRALIADGEKERALLTHLDTVRMPESAVEELRSGANWQALVDAVDVLPREFEQLIEYEFEPDRFRDVTTPTLLLVGEESSPGAIHTTKTLDETLPDSRIVRIDGADHFGLLSKPDRCVEEVQAFLEES